MQRLLQLQRLLCWWSACPGLLVWPASDAWPLTECPAGSPTKEGEDTPGHAAGWNSTLSCIPHSQCSLPRQHVQMLPHEAPTA